MKQEAIKKHWDIGNSGMDSARNLIRPEELKLSGTNLVAKKKFVFANSKTMKPSKSKEEELSKTFAGVKNLTLH